MRHQEILFNVTGQSFYFDPPEGRPTGTPTVTVYLSTADDDGTAEAATTGSCSVDSVNTTLSGSASNGTNSLSLTTGTGVTRLRRYLLTNTNGDQEWIEAIAVSGSTVTTRRPLVNDYASGASFQGCRISIAVDPTWVATKSKLTDALGTTWRTDKEANYSDWQAGFAGYRLRWSYTVNSVATIGVSYADLTRYSAKNLVSPLDVDGRFPGWIDRLPSDYREDEGQALITEAWHAVRMDAIGDGQVLRRIRNTEILRELVMFRANLIQRENETLENGNNSKGLELAQELYEERFNQLMKEPKYQTDQTGSGAGAQPNRLPVFRR